MAGYRKAANLRIRRNYVLTWNVDDLATAIQQQTMIHAAQILAFTSTQRQGGGAMDAAVLERYEFVTRSPDHETLVEHRRREGLVVRKLRLGARYVPIINGVHSSLSCGGLQKPSCLVIPAPRVDRSPYR
jgi:hypothetical protein